MTYAKITSIGDMSPFGAPVTIVGIDGAHAHFMIEETQCRLWHARLSAILEQLDKERPAA